MAPPLAPTAYLQRRQCRRRCHWGVLFSTLAVTFDAPLSPGGTDGVCGLCGGWLRCACLVAQQLQSRINTAVGDLILEVEEAFLHSD